MTPPVVPPPVVPPPVVPPPVVPPPVVPPPVVPSPGDNGKRTLVFRTSPSGAQVKVLRGNQVVHQAASPFTVELGADNYTWTVEHPGYAPNRSANRTVDLVVTRADTVDVSLVALSVTQLYEQGDNSYKEPEGRGCARAVESYVSIPRPASLDDQQGQRWLDSRYRMAICYQDLEEYENADRELRVILAHDPHQWQARNELGKTQCGVAKWEEGYQTFGLLLSSTRFDAKLVPGIRLLGRFGQLNCRYQEYARDENPERLVPERNWIEARLEEFIPSAEAAIQSANLARIRSDLERALSEAKKIRQTLSDG